MKKIVSILMTLMLCLSLCACSDENNTSPDTSTDTTLEIIEVSPDTTKQATDTTFEMTDVPTETEVVETTITKEEMLKNALEIDGSNVYREYNDNKVKFISQYEGANCFVSGTIHEIEMDHILVEDGNLLVSVYIPSEEIIELQKGQYVEVVGVAENIDYKQQVFAYVWVTVDFNTGYLVKSTYTFTGKFHSFYSTDGTHPQGICLEYVTDSGKTNYIELDLTKEQKGTLTNGAEITVEGKLCVNDNDMPYSASRKLVDITIK